MIASIAALILCATLAAWIYRVARGPTLADRALGLHGATLTACLLAAALAALARRPAWTDIALALFVADVMIVVMTLRLFRLRSLQAPLSSVEAKEQ